MRNFYIFNITNEMAVLTKDSPYNLFRILENIYFLNKNEYNTGLDILEQIIIPFDKDKLQRTLFNKYQKHDFYTIYRNKHTFNNLYLAEQTNLYVKNLYLYLTTSAIKPFFLHDLKSNKNLFVCDFENKDYFWLRELLI